MGPISSPETSIRNHHYSLLNNAEERSSHPLRGGSLKWNKAVLVHNKKAYRRRGGIAPFILNFDTRRSWGVNMMPLRFTPKKGPLKPLNFSRYWHTIWCTLAVPFSDPSWKSPRVTHTTPIKRVWKLPTSTQLRETWHTDSLDTVVLPSTSASH
jgi:hypothetical protein